MPYFKDYRKVSDSCGQRPEPTAKKNILTGKIIMLCKQNSYINLAHRFLNRHGSFRNDKRGRSVKYMFNEFKKDDNSLDLEEQERLFIESEIEKSKVFSEVDKTEEGQERMWGQLCEYSEIIGGIKTNCFSYDEREKDIEETIKKERFILCTGRTEEEIAGCYNLKVKEFEALLKNKKVLDLGCGESGLSKELSDKEIDTDIVSIDMKKESLMKSEAENGVVGSGDALPFSGEKFDLVLATYSLPYWASSEDMVEENLNEMLRVLKKDGILYIAPIVDILNRPSVDTNLDSHDLSIRENNSGVMEALTRIQTKFIQLLKELKEDDKYEIKLSKNYFQEMKYSTADRIDGGSPTIASIKKIK